MEPILSKQEIAELLQTIKEGNVPLQDVSRGERLKKSVPYRSFNLFDVSGRRYRSVKLANFDILIELFIENHIVSLSQVLQRKVMINTVKLESQSFQDYLLDQREIGAIGVFNQAPLKGNGLISYDRHLSFSLLEMLLGASGDIKVLAPNRKLSRIELSVLQTSMSLACADLDRSFSPITMTATELLRVESDLRLVSITDPDAEVIVASFDVEINGLSENMELVFPSALFEPYQQSFLDLSGVSRITDNSWSEIIAGQITTMEATVIARSAVIDLSLRQLASLRTGDVIPIDRDFGQDLQIVVEESVKFSAASGHRKGRKIARITNVLH